MIHGTLTLEHELSENRTHLLPSMFTNVLIAAPGTEVLSALALCRAFGGHATIAE